MGKRPKFYFFIFVYDNSSGTRIADFFRDKDWRQLAILTTLITS